MPTRLKKKSTAVIKLDYSPLVKDQARMHFLNGNAEESIAAVLRVPVDVIRGWAVADNWLEMLRQRRESPALRRSEILVDQEKPALIERHSRIIQKFDTHIEKALDAKKVKPRDLTNLAKAAGAVSSMADNTFGLKKPAGMQVFVQFNLRPVKDEDIRAQGLTLDTVSRLIDGPTSGDGPVLPVSGDVSAPDENQMIPA